MASLQDLLSTNRALLADGATGTNLFDAGLTAGDAPDMWNLERPEAIRDLYRSFVDAGADIILTNTFGSTRHRLKLHKAEDRVFEINKRGAELAREVADAAGRPVVVAGSIGPTGELFEPLGALTEEDAVAAFTEQAEGLKAGGADVCWIETMSAIEEIQAAARGRDRGRHALYGDGELRHGRPHHDGAAACRHALDLRGAAGAAGGDGRQLRRRRLRPALLAAADGGGQ